MPQNKDPKNTEDVGFGGRCPVNQKRRKK